MPYTLLKGLAWVLLALVLGLVIGWLLRSVIARRQLARARHHRADASSAPDQADLSALHERIEQLHEVEGERDRLRSELEDLRGAAALADVTAAAVAGPRPDSDASLPLDLDEAERVLGRAVAADDLTMIVGIGANVEELCRGIGICTWFDLAATEVSLLRTMLSDAGSRVRAHDPATWPHQATLLAQGRWDEFRQVSEQLRHDHVE